jgi:leader peptidase (prepilin peptidase)/N-methyltransferase
LIFSSCIKKSSILTFYTSAIIDYICHMHDPFLLALIFLFAIAFGSFINVLIYRLPRKISLVSPGSHCPKCNNPIKYYDNIPILSFILLRGKCRNCGARISFRYPLVELLSGVLVVLSFYHFGLTITGVEAAFLSLIFIPVFFIDLDFRIIPDFFTLPGIVIGLAMSFLPGAFIGWKESVIGLIVGGGVFFLVGLVGEFAFKKEAMGFGDVKFAAMLGAFLGWKILLLVLITGSFLGSVVGVAIIILSKSKNKSSYVPFGPFLVAAAFMSIYFGNDIINAYLNFVLHRHI